MRITNSMMTNSTLININRNQRYLDKIVRQIESTKKINVPSDDPILASRALKFRTNVSETEQFQRNVNSGLSWMEISESPLTDINTNLMPSIKELLTEGATGTETKADKDSIIASLKELVDQIGLDMNKTYAGRYAFSGYRTNEPPVLIEDDTAKSFAIEQTFGVEDIEKVMSYQKLKDSDVATKFEDVSVLKLAYKPTGGEDSQGNAVADGEDVYIYLSGETTGVPATVRHANDPDAYKDPGTGNYTYIPETGEIVFNKDDAIDPAKFAYDADTLTDDDPNNDLNGLRVRYEKTGFRQGELNPVVYFPCTDLNDTSQLAADAYPNNASGAYQYTMDDQEIQYEFASNTYITVNSLAKDTYTAEMYTDLRRLIEFTESLTISDQKILEQKYSADADPDKAVQDQLSNETALMNAALQDRFNNMLYLLDRHTSSTSTAQTQLGSRMMRLELLQTRLEDDRISYTKLMSDNEDTQMAYAIMQRANATAALEASLRANAGIAQLTLANYI